MVWMYWMRLRLVELQVENQQGIVLLNRVMDSEVKIIDCGVIEDENEDEDFKTEDDVPIESNENHSEDEEDEDEEDDE